MNAIREPPEPMGEDLEFNAFILIEMFTAMLDGSYLWIAGLVSNDQFNSERYILIQNEIHDVMTRRCLKDVIEWVTVNTAG